MSDRESSDGQEQNFLPPSPYDEPTEAFRTPEISDADRDAFYERHHRRPGRMSRVESFDDLDEGEVETRPAPASTPRNPVPMPPVSGPGGPASTSLPPGTGPGETPTRIPSGGTAREPAARRLDDTPTVPTPRVGDPRTEKSQPATPIPSVAETFPELAPPRDGQNTEQLPTRPHGTDSSNTATSTTPTSSVSTSESAPTAAMPAAMRALMNDEEPLPTTRALGEQEAQTSGRRRGLFGRGRSAETDEQIDDQHSSGQYSTDPHGDDPRGSDPRGDDPQGDDPRGDDQQPAETVSAANAPRGTLDLGLLLLRLALGSVAVAHGLQKLFGLWGGPGLSGYQDILLNNANLSIGFHAEVVKPLAIAGALGETLGGAMLIVGVFTPVAASAVLAVMLLAATFRITTAGGLSFFAADGGIEYEIVLAVMAAAIILTGPGLYSLDYPRRWARRPFVGSLAWLLIGVAAACAVWIFCNGTNPLTSPGNPR